MFNQVPPLRCPRAPNWDYMPFASIEEAIENFRQGRDGRGGRRIRPREHEGRLTLAAEKVTPEAINFTAMHARGLICLALSAEKMRCFAPEARPAIWHGRGTFSRYAP